MKTLTKITALIAIAIIFSVNLNASPVNFNEESYIDDIPFNTTEIYNEIITENQLADFSFEEEQYIDDIPFNTECISAYCQYQKAISVEFNFEEEQYINDIEL
jgi:hypothetical protein